MERHEYHDKWCHLLDEVTVRAHQALLEAGYDCELIEDDVWVLSGHVHKNLWLLGGADNPTVQRAVALSLPDEMRADWLSMKGFEVPA